MLTATLLAGIVSGGLAPPNPASIVNGKGLEMTDFDSAFASFFEGCQRITADHYAKHYPNLSPGVWRLDPLQKRIRIVLNDASHCFVDRATGDVLKPANWGTPAKHARGNIFDKANGLGSMGPYGPAYLR
jgi:hypothetical protein